MIRLVLPLAASKDADAQSCLLQETNKDLLTAARRQHQRATRTKGHWGAGRVMNLDVIEERAEKARSKAKDKKDKQMNKELNQTIKAFCRLDPSLLKSYQIQVYEEFFNSAYSSIFNAHQPGENFVAGASKKTSKAGSDAV